MQILLVDDEHYVADDLEIAFNWSEYGINHVFKAYSGMQALEVLTQNHVDILITDIAMPGMNGLELIGKAKAINSKVKCLLLTGYPEFDYAQEAIHKGVEDYLVKPLDHNKLKAALQKVTAKITEELRYTGSYDKAIQTFREHLPALKDKLLNELIQGKTLPQDRLLEQLNRYELPFRQADEIYLLLIRLEDHFTSFGADSLLLFEYAVTNIANEMLGEMFHVWHCRDAYDYLVFIVTAKADQRSTGHNSENYSDETGYIDSASFSGEAIHSDNSHANNSENDRDNNSRSSSSGTDSIAATVGKADLHSALVHLANQLNDNVNQYLKGGISVVLSYAGIFGTGISEIYDDAVLALRQQVGNGKGYFLSLDERRQAAAVQPLKLLYESPAWIYLLETGQWEAYKQRLHKIKHEFDTDADCNEEYLEEIHAVMRSSFHYMAHRQHVLLSEWLPRELQHTTPFRSISQLVSWGETIVTIIQSKLDFKTYNNQLEVANAIKIFVSAHLAEASLQSVADHVSMHPAYVSKMFKQVTGSGLSDYILMLKMEQAIAWLRGSEMKIYEISDKLGYANSQYFIKVFKEQFGMTPQDFRSKVWIK